MTGRRIASRAARAGFILLALLSASRTMAQNLIPNGGFDGQSIAGWQASQSDASWSGLDAHGGAVSGSLRLDRHPSDSFGFAQRCVAVQAGQSYHGQAAAYGPAEQSGQSATFDLIWYGAPDCSGPSIGASLNDRSLSPGTWLVIDTQAQLAPGGAQGVSVGLGVFGETDGPATVQFDDVILEPSAPADCLGDDSQLCLGGGRFRVTATWATGDGQEGAAQAVQLTPDTGYLWFFSSANVEAVIKVIDGCSLGGHWWVFAGGLTNVNTVIKVEDLEAQVSKTYTNPQGKPFAPIQDTSAFATCP